MKTLSCVAENPSFSFSSCRTRCPDEVDYFGQNMRTVHRKMLTTSLKYNSRLATWKAGKGTERFNSMEGCIFGAVALWLQNPLQWDFVSVRKKNYTSPQVRVRLFTSLAIPKHTWPLLSSQQPLVKEPEWTYIPAELLASSDLSYCINTDHTVSEQKSLCFQSFKPKLNIRTVRDCHQLNWLIRWILNDSPH